MVDAQLPIRLIALDIDGTLVGEDLVIGDRTVAAIAEATRRGIAVSLVTGRMATSAVPFAEALGLTGPIVAQQGALIRSMPRPGSARPGRLLYHRPLDPDVFILLMFLRDRLKKPAALFGVFLIIHGVMRFAIEIVRINPNIV